MVEWREAMAPELKPAGAAAATGAGSSASSAAVQS